MRPATLALGALALASAGAAAPRGPADPEPFFRRLESIGLSTANLRGLQGRMQIRYRESSEVAEASWNSLTNRLFLPGRFAEAGGARVRFDLATHEIDTLIHELVHAQNDLAAREGDPEGSVSREHWECMNFVWADLYQDPRHQLLGLARFPRRKANEVTGYFLGKAIGELFQVVEQVVAYNTQMQAARPASPAEAEAWGARFLLPPEDAGRGWARRLAATRFGEVSVLDEAHFSANAFSAPVPIEWDESDRAWLKTRMYRGLLGLDPPRDVRELVERMNTLDTAWLRERRAEVRAARAAHVQGLAGAGAAEAVGFGGLQGGPPPLD